MKSRSPLEHLPAEQAVEALAALCRKYDGKDRWMLEALGIGARGKENALYARLLDNFTVKWSSRFGQLLWEFRPSDALPKLITLLKDDSLSLDERAEVLDALSAQAKPEAALAVTEFFLAADQPQELAEKSFARLSQQLYSEWTELRSNPVSCRLSEREFKLRHSRPRLSNWPAIWRTQVLVRTFWRWQKLKPARRP